MKVNSDGSVSICILHNAVYLLIFNPMQTGGAFEALKSVKGEYLQNDFF